MKKNDPGLELSEQSPALLKARADLLQKELQKHNELYFQKDAPVIEDSEYDALLREYELILKDHPQWRTADSADLTVGAEAIGADLDQITRTQPMLSLEKALNVSEIEDFAKRLARGLGFKPQGLFTMPKFDGLAVELYYRDKKLVLAATRGDGRQGENITANAQTIKDIPQKLSAPAPSQEVIVRGEVYMLKSEFARLNDDREKQGLPLFANPRNAAAGSLRQLDAAVTGQRKLQFFAYGLADPQVTGSASYAQALLTLANWGFPVEHSPYSGLREDLPRVLEVFEDLSQKRDDLKFEVDGLVITLDDLTQWSRLGITARAPRWAVAAKFPPRLAETRVIAINIQVGRLGALTPVAVMEPVQIGGATITQASLHNEDDILQKDVQIGDWVLLKRAGDIIPDIVRVLKEKRTPGKQTPFVFPQNCPVCGQKAVRLLGEAIRKCQNYYCPAQIEGRLIHFASKNGLDIDGLGQKAAALLIKENLVKKPSDIFRLTQKEISALPGLGQKSAENLISGINKARSADLWRFINGLSIPLVGESLSRDLADRYLTLAAFAADLAKGTASVKPSAGSLGPKTIDSLVAYYKKPQSLEFLADLMDPSLVQPSPPADPKAQSGQKAASDSDLSGKKFVLTGTLSTLSREEAKEKLLAKGAQVISAVSKNTEYVVAGEKSGQKLQNAQKLGVQILNEEQFLKLLS
jgi:DNA ligase (NAD+)